MKTKKEKLHGRGWKSRFVRLSSILMLCFNVLSAPLSAIGIATIAVTTVTLVVSCDKEEQKQEQPNPQQKHNVELVMRPSNQYQNIAMDTIYKYNADPTVDSIFMVPEQPNMWSEVNTNGLKAMVNYLRQRHNVNPNKVFGKGDLELKRESIQSNPEIVRFFADTLRYHVIVNNNSK